jgi:hypothetical protein
VRGVKDGGDPNTPLTVVVGLVGAILLFVAIVFLQAIFRHAEDAELARKVTSAPAAELESLRAEQLGRLNGYRVVDPQKGVVAIPIDRAMELVARESGSAPARAK